jgi:hypothetical protein
MSRYRVKRCSNSLIVLNENRDFRVGSIQCEVRDRQGEKIGMATSMDEAVALLAAHVANKRPRWEDGGAGSYVKITHEYCDLLAVEQSEDGRWAAFRNEYELADENGPVTFATAQEARHAAELHADDGRPNAKCPEDGLRWSGPSDPAEDLEDRLHCEHRLGEIVADAAEAIAQAKAELGDGMVELSTVRRTKDLLAILREMHEDYQFGSYDTESGSRDPYFVVSEGPEVSRVSFDEAAYHYGKLALRKRLGEDVGDETLRQMLADVLKRLPAPDRLRKAA